MFIKAETRKDFQAIEALAREIWTEHYVPIIGEVQVKYMLDMFQSEKAIAEQIKKGFLYYIIEEDGQLIGYLGVHPRGKELFLSKIYVKSSERRKGFGQKAMTFIENLAAEGKMDKITLTVNRNNLDSIKAYKKMGFEKVGEILQNIGNGFVMDDYKMQKKIQSHPAG